MTLVDHKDLAEHSLGAAVPTADVQDLIPRVALPSNQCPCTRSHLLSPVTDASLPFNDRFAGRCGVWRLLKA